MYKLFIIIITCFTLIGCSFQATSENIDPEIINQGEIFAQQLYNVINDIDSFKSIDSDKISEFYNQDTAYLNTDEEEFVKIIEGMFIQTTAYYASYYVKEDKLHKEVRQKLKQIKNKLENEYGIKVD